MNGTYNLIGVKGARTPTLDFLFTPQFSQGANRFGGDNGGRSTTITSSVSQTFVIQWGDGTRSLLTGTSFNLFNHKTYPDNTQRRMIISFGNSFSISSIHFGQGVINGRLPVGFNDLVNLTSLGLPFNSLGFLPPELSNMPKLESLDLRSCSITTLPDTWDRFKELLTLTLTSNNIPTAQFGTTFFQMPKLATLSVQWASLPAAAAPMPTMRTLNLRGWAGALPSSFVTIFPGLTSLDMRSASGTVTFPSNFSSLPLKTIRLGAEVLISANPVIIGSQAPLNLANNTSIQTLEIRQCAVTSLVNIELMTGLVNLQYSARGQGLSTAVLATGALPAGWQNLTKLKNIELQGRFAGQPARLDQHIADYYNLVVANASMTPGGNNNIWRNVTCTISGEGNPTATGTYQQPAGYVAGSSNGTPASSQEMRWVLNNQYGWNMS